MQPDVQRKLTTILAADAEGYSRVMEADEVRALGALRAARAIFARLIERHGGRIANTAGDGLIADFPSVVEAVQCAIEVQNELGKQKGDPGGALRFRIGIHLGDVIVDGADLLGEGVNLAARLQGMAEPGGILISQQVYDQVYSKLSVGFEYVGEKRPKNYAQDVPVYRVSRGEAGAWFGAPRRAAGDAAPRNLSEITLLRRDLVRQARILAVLLAGLLVVNLVTGAAFWAKWPALAMAVYLGLKAAPVLARPPIGERMFRGGVIGAALVMANLFTWSGYPWSLWPLGGLAAIALLRHLRSGQG